MHGEKNWFISDLDGTLLGNLGVLTGFSKDKLDILLKQGFLFSVASARSLQRIREALGDLPLSLPVIQLNGGIVSDYKTNQIFKVVDMEYPLISDIFSILAKMEVQFIATGIRNDEGKKDFCLLPEKQNEPLRAFYEDRLKNRDNRVIVGEANKEIINECVVSLTLCDLREKMEKALLVLREEFSTKLDICPMGMPTNEWAWCTVQSKNATKGEALRFIADHCGLDILKATVFGDELNDLPMFERAGCSIAPKNAISEIKEKANHIIDYHHQDSVAKYLWDAALNTVKK